MRVNPSGEQVELRHGGHRAVIVEVSGGSARTRPTAGASSTGTRPHEMCTGARGQLLVPWPNRLRDGRYEFDGERFQVPLSEPEKMNAIHGFLRWEHWHITAAVRRPRGHGAHAPPARRLPVRAAHGSRVPPRRRRADVHRDRDQRRQPALPVRVRRAPVPPRRRRALRAMLAGGTGAAATWSWTSAPSPPARPMSRGPHTTSATRRQVHGAVIDTAFLDAGARRRRSRLGAPVERSARTAASACGWTRTSRTTCCTRATRSRSRSAAVAPIGVEPMTCAPNAFASGDGLITLAPGESVSGRWGISPLARLTVRPAHGCVGSSSSEKWPPAAISSRRARSVSHSTGAWSSVSGSRAGATRAQLRSPPAAPSTCSSCGQAGETVAQRDCGDGVVEADDQLVEAQRRPDAHVGEDGRQRAAHRLGEPVVAGHARHVEGDRAAALEVAARQREELLRHQPERARTPAGRRRR